MRSYTFTIDGKRYQVEVEESSGDDMSVVVNGRSYTVSREMRPTRVVPAADSEQPMPSAPAVEPAKPIQSLSTAGPTEDVRAPLPGKIISVAVVPGSRVQYGDALCTLEAMKMESVIRATVAGVVVGVHVQEAASVQYNDLLVSIKKTE